MTVETRSCVERVILASLRELLDSGIVRAKDQVDFVAYLQDGGRKVALVETRHRRLTPEGESDT